MNRSSSVVIPSNRVIVSWYVFMNPASACQCRGTTEVSATTVSLPPGMVIPLNCIEIAVDWPGCRIISSSIPGSRSMAML